MKRVLLAALILVPSCAAREEKDENNIVYINLDGSAVTCKDGVCERTYPSKPRPIPTYVPLPDSVGQPQTPSPNTVQSTGRTNVNVTVNSNATATNTNNIDMSQCQKTYQFQDQNFTCTVACPPTPQQPQPPAPCKDKGTWKSRPCTSLECWPPKPPVEPPSPKQNPQQRPPQKADLTYETSNCGLPSYEVLTY